MSELALHTPKEIAASLYASGMRCNCDLDNWQPEAITGHSHVCRIHQTALERHRNGRGVAK